MSNFKSHGNAVVGGDDARPAECRIRTSTRGEKMATAYDVIADLPGTEDPDEVIVIGGHYDSVWGSQGSQDNAAGTAVVIELARVMAAIGSRRTLRFMAFGGEEFGLRGAVAYVKKLKDQDDRLKKNKDFEPDGLKSDLDKLRFMVNVDVQGSPLGHNFAYACGHDDIGASVRLLASESGRSFEVDSDTVYSSDNAVFGKAGIPSLAFARRGGSTSFGHTAGDMLQTCDSDALAFAGTFIMKWVRRYVAEAPSFAFDRTIDPKMQDKIDKYFKGRDVLARTPAGPEKKYRKRGK